jgi:hypothetical protein
MAIEDYVPNIFGGVPVGFEGLLGTDQAGLDRTAALQKRANLAGLLGFGAALAQGMGAGGARRSALQNVLTAAAQGFSGAGQTYEAGIKNAMTQQQFALQQRQMAGIQAMKLKYPDLADEFDTNPAGAFRLVAEREQARIKPITVGEGQTVISPQGEVLFSAPGAKKKSTAVVGNVIVDLETGQPIYTGQAESKPVVVGGNLVDPTTGRVVFTAPKEEKPTTSIEEYNFYLSQGGKKTYEQFLKEKIPSTNISVNTGQLSKPTAGKVEEGVLADAAAITRLNSIQFSYKPEYQNIKFRTGQAWNTLKDKFGGLPETDKRQLAEYSQYKQNSLQNLNQTIKDLTGAAMGVQEADRIIASLPNAGTDIFGGDSPTEFEAKLNNAVKQTKYALARKNYALKKGLNWESLPLDSLPSLINKRGKEIAAQYKLDLNKPADLQIIDRQLAAEFGIAF